MISRRTLLATGTATMGLAGLSLPAHAQEASAPLNALFERYFDQTLVRNPERATGLGDKRGQDRWNDDSDAYAAQNLAFQVKTNQEVAALAATMKLNQTDALSVRLFDKLTQNAKANAPYRGHAYVFDQHNGAQSGIPTFLANNHSVANLEDAQAYIARLEAMPEKVGGLLARSADSAAKGITPPRHLYDFVLSNCQNLLAGAPFTETGKDSVFWSDIKGKIDKTTLDTATKDRLKAQARAALMDKVKPAYEAIIAEMTKQQAKARTTDGVWALPDGEAYYAERLATQTTTRLTANEIHQLGLDAVARIHGEMETIMRKVGFTGTRDTFFDFMETDPRFFVADTPAGKASYVAQATALIDTMRDRLPTAFNLIPKAPLEVRAVEPFREASAGLAFYSRPSADGKRPGYYYVNTFNVKAIPTYQMEALAYHEGLPGHHMQIAIAQELQGIPRFRKFSGFTAYSEGWGLYTERLGKDMGFYQDPYSDFGRQVLELRRAIRLVVDTGLHAKRWPKEQAIAYILANQPGDLESATRDINRYIVMPGQATAYMIGQMEILRLRADAQRRLGSRYDIKKFHDIVLGSGFVPLDILKELVEAWV